MTKNVKTSSDDLRNDTDIIWHYTSMDVFKKMMLEETGLYATHVRFLNDSSEFKYGWDVIISSVEKYVEEHKGSKDKKTFQSFLRSLLNSQKQNLLNIEIKHFKKWDVFVTCFSRDCDSLYQWRCYTPQGGVSLGFSRKELNKIIFGKKTQNLGKIGNSSYKKFSYCSDTSHTAVWGCLGKCIYKEIEQRKTIIDFFSTEGNDFLLKAFFLACLMKHDSFNFEKEERIIYAGISRFDNIEIIGNKPRVPILGASQDKIRHLIKGVFVSPHGDKEHNYYLTHLWAHQYDLDWEPSYSRSPYVGG